MSAVAKLEAPKMVGARRPRLAPPTPARSDAKAFRQTAAELGITLMPWQETAARYLTARGKEGRLLYRDVCIVVARQNGKTTLMKPLIIRALRDGKRVLHVAQNRELPRHMFGVIADALSSEPDLFPKRRGRTIWPRYGSGQEEISLKNGGWYRIAASTQGGARGWPTDLVIFDEIREIKNHEVMAAVEPTLTMSTDPQLVLLSNAGDESSVVLNATRERAGQDESLAYLEWSADPALDAGDRRGWAQANPAFGHYPSVERTLESAHRKAVLTRTLPVFEMEHLCRFQASERQSFVALETWQACVGSVGDPVQPVMAVSMDPQGTRASAALAWQRPDQSIALRLLYDVTGNPVNADRLGADLRDEVRARGARITGYDPHTDTQLTRYLPKIEPIAGQKFANASARFASVVEGGRVVWEGAAAVGADLTWTARKPHDAEGSFEAVRADDGRPITAALAAIRAVWLASAPRPTSVRRPTVMATF